MVAKLFKILYFFLFFGVSTIGGMLIPFLMYKGYDPIQIGTLISLFTLSGMIGQLLVGYLCDKFRTIRKIFLPSIIIISISGTISIVFEIKIIFYIAFFTLGLFSSVLVSLVDSWVMENSQDVKSKFSRLRVFAAIGWAFGVLLAGFIASRFGYRMVSIIYLVTTGIAALVAIKLQDVQKETTESGNFKTLIINKQYDFTIITLLLICIVFRAYLQLVPYTIEVMGGNTADIGIYNSICSLSEIVMLVAISKIMHKISPDKILTIAPIALLFQLLILYLAPNIIVIYVSGILQLFTYPIILMVGRIMVDRISPLNLRTTSQLVGFAMYNSLGIIIASFLVGSLIEYRGIKFTNISIIVISIISILMSLFYDRSTKDEII